MGSKPLKVSWIILFILACILLIMSLSFLFSPKLFLNSDFQVFIGQEFNDFAKTNSLLANYLYILVRQFSIANLIIGIYSMGIILTAYRRGVKWAWYVILSGSIIGYGFTIFVNAYIGNTLWVLTVAIFLVIALFSLVLGIKPTFKKEST